MTEVQPRRSQHRWRKAFRFYLAFSWLLGLICGSVVSAMAGEPILSLMRSALYSSVSIVGVLCVSIFPILFSAYAVFLSNFVLLLPICFAKAFLFSFVSLGISRAFASAGWLIGGLLLYSDWTSLPILYWFWLRSLSPERSAELWETILAFALIGLMGSIHYSIISPFLVGLIGI